jgi:hypothetical protein
MSLDYLVACAGSPAEHFYVVREWDYYTWNGDQDVAPEIYQYEFPDQVIRMVRCALESESGIMVGTDRPGHVMRLAEEAGAYSWEVVAGPLGYSICWLAEDEDDTLVATTCHGDFVFIHPAVSR